MTRRYWVETLGCPKNQVDSDKLVGTLVADGMAAADGAERRRPRRRQHLRLHRGGPPGVDRHRPGPGRRTPAGRPAGRHRLHGRALRRRAGRRPARGRRRSPASACRSPSAASPAPAVPSFDLLNLPRPRGRGAVGLREGGRGLRPGLRVLRHPDVPGPAALAHDRRRSSPRSTRSSVAGDRARRPGPRRATGATRARASGAIVPAGRGGGRRGSTGCGCSTSTRPTSPTRSSTPSCATGVPYFDLSLQHVSTPLLRRMRRWGDGDRFLAASTPSARREPDAAFRSNFIVGYPGETEDDHDELLRVRRGGPARLVRASSPTRARRAPTPPASTARSPPGLVAERLAELRELQDAHHRRPA